MSDKLKCQFGQRFHSECTLLKPFHRHQAWFSKCSRLFSAVKWSEQVRQLCRHLTALSFRFLRLLTVLKLPPQMNIGTPLHRTTMHVRAVQRLTKQSEECIDAWDIPSAILKVRDVQPSWILQTTLQVLSVKFDALIQPCPHNSAGILQASNWFCTHGDGALAPHPSLSSNGAPGMSMPHTAMPIRMS